MSSWLTGTIYFQEDETVKTKSIPRHPFSYWLLSREVCLFERFDLGLVPKKKREDALAQQVKAVAPFKNYAYYRSWYGSSAVVWIWDSSLQTRAIRLAGVKENITICPESSFVLPKSDGFFGFKGISGYFLQFWKGGELLAETSWSSQPEKKDLETFFQSHGTDQETERLLWDEIDYVFSTKLHCDSFCIGNYH